MIHRFYTTLVTAAGAGSTNTQPFVGGLCRHIFIQSSTTGTTFQANITDPDSLQVRTYSGVATTVSDANQILPVLGTYTIRITNASADGLFSIFMMVEE